MSYRNYMTSYVIPPIIIRQLFRMMKDAGCEPDQMEECVEELLKALDKIPQDQFSELCK